MMRTYKEEYQHWLDSPALNEQEWAELNSIAGDDKEIESRFFAPLSFGTAGLRGTMGFSSRRPSIFGNPSSDSSTVSTKKGSSVGTMTRAHRSSP